MQFFTLIIISILCGAEIDIIVPSFPKLKEVFNISNFQVELTLTANLVAHCLSALLVGNLGDRYGKKIVMMYGLLLFNIGTIFCIFSSSFYFILFGRIIQGIAMAAPAILSYVMAVNMYNYDKQKQQESLSILNGLTTLAMALAPLIGAFTLKFFTWHGNFILLFIIGIVSLILCYKYSSNDSKDLNVTLSLSEYTAIFKSKILMNYVFSICLLVLGYWVFVAIAPILYIEDLKIPTSQYGLYQGAMAFIFSIINFSSGKIFKATGQKNGLYLGLLFLCIFVVSSIFSVIYKIQDPYIITAIMMIYAVGMTLSTNMIYPYMLEAAKNSKGKISAIVVLVKMTMIFFTLQFLTLIYDKSFKYIAIIISLSAIFAIISCLKLIKKIEYI